MKRLAFLAAATALVVTMGCGGCEEEAPAVCAELSGDACDCPEDLVGTYDCNGECHCSDPCVANESATCDCADGSNGFVDCEGSCQCARVIGNDMGSVSDLGSSDAGATDSGNDMMSQPGDRVMIPAGSFFMGCDSDLPCDADEAPEHEVTLSQYWIDRTEVSRTAFQRCIDDGDCTTPTNGLDLTGDLADLPVTSITFAQATDYCTWAGGRLPTEAEWERACTGGDSRTFPWGDEDATCQLANTAGCAPGGGNGDMVVDSLEAGASPEGALHMAGNVWEWTADWYDQTAYANHASDDPTGPATGTVRVYRGGSSGNDPSLARCRNRASTYSPDVGGSGLGFRCAYD